MTRYLLLAAAMSLAAGCATTKPEAEYQSGWEGRRQSKADAERSHVGKAPRRTTPEGFDVPPKVLSAKFPDYPHHLRRAGVEGKVMVAFTVGPDGSVSDPAIQGSAEPDLAALALNAVMGWRFSPATKQGTPVSARIQQPFVFQTE